MNIVVFLMLFGCIVVAGAYLIFAKNIRHSILAFLVINILVGAVLILNSAWIVGVFLIACNFVISLLFWNAIHEKKNLAHLKISKITILWTGSVLLFLYSLIVAFLDINVVLKKNMGAEILSGMANLHQNVPIALFMMLFIAMVCGIVVMILHRFNKKIEE